MPTRLMERQLVLLLVTISSSGATLEQSRLDIKVSRAALGLGRIALAVSSNC